jgi:hypothetical protein
LDDRVLFGELAGGQRNGDATHLGIQICETVLALNGVACLSWQQHSFNQKAATFEQIVRHCQQLTASEIWCPAPREIAEWWMMRNDVKVSARMVGKRWWLVELQPPEELSDALAFVLAIPSLGKVRVLRERILLPVKKFGALGRMSLWGVPLTLEPSEAITLSVGVTI